MKAVFSALVAALVLSLGAPGVHAQGTPQPPDVPITVIRIWFEPGPMVIVYRTDLKAPDAKDMIAVQRVMQLCGEAADPGATAEARATEAAACFLYTINTTREIPLLARMYVREKPGTLT